MDKKRTNRDIFQISYGNLKVLETIPEMMTDEVYRQSLRDLVIKYLHEKKVSKLRGCENEKR